MLTITCIHATQGGDAITLYVVRNLFSSSAYWHSLKLPVSHSLEGLGCLEPDAEVDTEAEVAALIEGIGDALHLNSGGKGIVLAGDDSAATTGFIYFVDDTLDGTNGTISTTDVTTVANFTLDLNTFTAGNFI